MMMIIIFIVSFLNSLDSYYLIERRPRAEHRHPPFWSWAFYSSRKCWPGSWQVLGWFWPVFFLRLLEKPDEKRAKSDKKDLEDVPDHVAKDLKFHFAKEIKDVLKVAVPQVFKSSK